MFQFLKKRLVFEEMKEPLVIIIMGPQGSGKGTQGELLKSHFGIPLITVGQMLRDEVKKGTPLGEKIASYINRGVLVTPQMAYQVVEQRLKESDAQKGYILDGYPRDMDQVKLVEKLIKPTIAILLDIPKAETLRRLAGRRVCGNCKLNFNIATLDRGVTICTKCGGTLEARADDVAEAIEKRLIVYQTETKPVIQFYKKMGVTKKIDGVGTPRDVWKRILKIVPKKEHHA